MPLQWCEPGMCFYLVLFCVIYHLEMYNFTDIRIVLLLEYFGIHNLHHRIWSEPSIIDIYKRWSAHLDVDHRIRVVPNSSGIFTYFLFIIYHI